MAKLPTIKKILREDVRDAPAWINSIIEPFNSLAEFVYQALNKSITFRENITSFIKEITYTTPSTYPVIDDIEFMNEMKVRPIGVFIMQAFDRSTYDPASGPVYVPWIDDNGTIVIKSITGLAASKVYTIRLLVIG